MRAISRVVTCSGPGGASVRGASFSCPMPGRPKHPRLGVNAAVLAEATAWSAPAAVLSQIFLPGKKPMVLGATLSATVPKLAAAPSPQLITWPSSVTRRKVRPGTDVSNAVAGHERLAERRARSSVADSELAVFVIPDPVDDATIREQHREAAPAATCIARIALAAGKTGEGSSLRCQCAEAAVRATSERHDLAAIRQGGVTPARFNCTSRSVPMRSAVAA